MGTKVEAAYVWSPKTSGFYPVVEKERLVAAGQWPDDGVDVTDAEYNSLFPVPPGQYIDTVDGHPGWVDMPPPTQEEIVAQAVIEKQNRIDAANDYMNGKQWPGKAAMGRLKDAEKVQYNAWLDYLDALEAIDTSSAPDINWPVPLEV
ncbi:tail fiber assembly protein [Escherichia coli]|uniref:tail fiber assembly protein n=1 Tax=Escherichia coli TaxID=562 RepID=UPI000BE80A65|nr:tail fiber assembly protein [Escherichia coli]EEY9907820.1 tail fiber assembly protein [Escherichia coli]EFH4491694.1 tail fiber assembly protein [Escherichia coli]EFH5042300.1 tail fiber assembly protein [Escherichia coli]EFH6221244.1 tail fiber assembly protein [Escherichia coli]EFN3839806.1 tail fiber assembly protein [Escherichia coli]